MGMGNMVYVLVLLSLTLAGAAVWALIWAINKNQFDDLDSPAYSILEEDEPQQTNGNNEHTVEPSEKDRRS